jgi:predicted nucleic acid-binding protein
LTGILVDTSILIDVLQGKTTPEAEEMLSRASTSISILSYYEVCKFVFRTGKGKELGAIKQQMDSFQILGITTAICEEAAHFAYSKTLSMADAVIYATARQNGLSLATRDSDLKGMEGVVFLKPKK